MRNVAALAARNTHPCLPNGITFGQVIELIERHGRAAWGLGLARRDALLRMMRSTTVSDWSDPARDPVCYRAQQDIAAEIGITDRALRAHERALARLGLILIDTTAGGRRSGTELRDGRRLGINLRPLIERIGELIALDHARHTESQRQKVLRLECSAAKRDVRCGIERLIELDPRHPELPGLLQQFASWPRRYAGFRSADELEHHLAEVQSLRQQVDEILSCCAESSGMAESQIPAIQNTNPKNPEICSGSTASERPGRKRPDTPHDAAGPDGPADCREKIIGRVGPEDNPNDVSWITPQIVREIAGPCFRERLDYHCAGGPVTVRAMRSAAFELAAWLGINESAVLEAAEVFGDLRMALCVLLIEANTEHPTRPIHSPGGALRAFTRLQQAGQFNLAGSLIGLVERRRAAPCDD